MKTIDVKSLLIGTLLASTIFLGVAAAGCGKSKATKATETLERMKKSGQLEDAEREANKK